ncbi:MAG: hypothetical protein FWE13_00415 [Firmicutes bacterium]|nr:hypothetical protein [Bacillota bacterium]
MKYKNEIIFIYHLLAIFVLLALLFIDFTGVLTHEILGIIFIVMLVFHIVFCSKAYKNTFSGAFKYKKPKAIAKICVMIAILIALVLQIISAITLSHHIFSYASTANYSIWLVMHRWISRIMLTLFIALIALFLKDIAMLIKIEDSSD